MSLEAVLGVLGAAAMVVGSLFAVIGGIGLLRLPDFYSRLHGAGITDTMGAGLILAGLMLRAGPSLVAFKVATIVFFLLITSPTSAHALSKSALTHGLEPLLGSEEDRPST